MGFFSILFVIAAIVLATGCSQSPFQEVSFGSVKGVSSSEIREDFARAIPSRFEILESVKLEYRGQSSSILGYTEVDDQKNTISFAAFSAAGIKLGEARSVGDRVDGSFALNGLGPQLDDRKLAGSLIQAIRQVYFDRVPKDGAVVHPTADRFYFHQPSGLGMIEFVFGGPRNALVEKSYRQDGTKLWQVTYFEYQSKESKLYPSKIVLQNHERNYEITLRLKEVF